MRWSDEHYVKLYTRDTPTWRGLCWQAKALLPLLMRVVDKAGLLECGEFGRGAVALMVGLPEDVATAGLEGLERAGVVAWSPQTSTLTIPNFEEAQEARKSDLLRKREERQRARDKANAKQLGITEGVSHGVTRRHEMSQPVTLQPDPDPDPSPTQSRSDQPPKHAPRVVEAPTAPDDAWTGDDFWRWAQSIRAKSGLVPEKPPNPRALGAWWSAALMTPGITPRALKAGFARFGQSKHWERAEPPFPFRAFVAGWSDFTRPENTNAAAS